MVKVPDSGLESYSWFEMVTGILYTHIYDFGAQYLFLGCKEHPCPLSPDLGLCWPLEGVGPKLKTQIAQLRLS